MKNKIHKDEILTAAGEKKDLRAKSLLSIKEVIAQILIFLVPMFGDLSVDYIVKNCLPSPPNPESPFARTLNTENRNPGDSHFIKDLNFLIDTPKPVRALGMEYRHVLASFESQEDRPSDYNLEVRVVLYGCQNLLAENRLLGLGTTKSMYQNAAPSWSFWFDFDPESKKCGTTVHWLRTDGGTFSSPASAEPTEGSFLVIYHVKIGNDVNLEEKNVYSFLYRLLKDDNSEQVVKLFEEYGFHFRKGEVKMMLSGIEKKALEQGINQGIVIGSEERAKEVYQNLLKLGVPEETARQAVYNGQLPQNFDSKED